MSGRIGNCPGCGVFIGGQAQTGTYGNLLYTVALDPHQAIDPNGDPDRGERCPSCAANLASIPRRARLSVDQWTDDTLANMVDEVHGSVTLPLAAIARWVGVLENLNLFPASPTEYIAITQEIREEIAMHPAVLDAQDAARRADEEWNSAVAAVSDAEWLVSLSTRGLTV